MSKNIMVLRPPFILLCLKTSKSSLLPVTAARSTRGQREILSFPLNYRQNDLMYNNLNYFSDLYDRCHHESYKYSNSTYTIDVKNMAFASWVSMSMVQPGHYTWHYTSFSAFILHWTRMVAERKPLTAHRLTIEWINWFIISIVVI